MFDNLFDSETLPKTVQTMVITLIALLLVAGVKGRLAQFARWIHLPRLALTPLRLGLQALILVGAVVLILGRWGFQINGIMAVLGTLFGLIAIGFVAMWSMLSNFLCTLVLVISKAFRVGDEIELPTVNVRGKVSDLSLIFTTLESGPNEFVLVPNNTFFQVVFKRRDGTVTKELEHHLEEAPNGPLRSRPAST